MGKSFHLNQSLCYSDQTSYCTCINIYTYMYSKTDNPNYKPHKFLRWRPRGAFYLGGTLKASKTRRAFNAVALPDESQGFVTLNVIYTQINMMDYVIDCFQDPSASHPVPGRPIFFRFCNSNRGFNGFMCGWQPTVV